MLTRLLWVGLLTGISFLALAENGGLSRNTFYAAMASENLDLISGQEQAARSLGQIGFEGALLMKKAGLSTSAYEKLSLFRKGHKLLDEAIEKDATNAELRFLRLMVQEHAPMFLDYSGDLENDTRVIKQRFKLLSPETQRFILDYSRTSTQLSKAGLDKL